MPTISEERCSNENRPKNEPRVTPIEPEKSKQSNILVMVKHEEVKALKQENSKLKSTVAELHEEISRKDQLLHVKNQKVAALGEFKAPIMAKRDSILSFRSRRKNATNTGEVLRCDS